MTAMIRYWMREASLALNGCQALKSNGAKVPRSTSKAGWAGKIGQPTLAKTEDVHGHGQGLGQIKRNADGAAHFQAQPLRDDGEGHRGRRCECWW